MHGVLRVSDLPHSDKIKYLNAEDATVAHVVSIREEVARRLPMRKRRLQRQRLQQRRPSRKWRRRARRTLKRGGQEARGRGKEVSLGRGKRSRRPDVGPFLVVGLGNPGLGISVDPA